MQGVESATLPEGVLLDSYRRKGAYTDCYMAEVQGRIVLEEFIRAFYTTRLFRLERLILKWAVSLPSTDIDVQALACGERQSFAAWRVEKRTESQLLLTDFRGRTRSWLMAAIEVTDQGVQTRLYFGSAVVPVKNRRTGKPGMGLAFRALLGFHKLYSVALLSAAKKRLAAQQI